MNIILYLSTAIVAYLIGSIPTSIWVGKSKFGLDIRDHGSGNAGATNTFRVLGKKAGIFVMTVDVIKGSLATALPIFFYHLVPQLSIEYLILWKITCGVCAVLGHIFPIYEKFKGGKGVATLLGMVIAVNPAVAGVCVLIFLIVLLISKYVSLGSMIAAFSFPLLLLIPLLNPVGPHPILMTFGILIFLMVVFTHKKNIKRLKNGEENKTFLIKKKD